MKLIPLILVLAATSCATKRTGGIATIPARHDADRPHIEYRVVEIQGRQYVATRSTYWPGGTEKWDLVGLKP